MLSVYWMARENKPVLTWDWVYPLSEDVLEEVGLLPLDTRLRSGNMH